MKSPRMTNLLWGVVVLAVASIPLLRALDAIPNGIFDLILRSWPVLLVLLGLGIFLRDRVKFGSLIALLVSAGLVVGIAVAAFSSRVGQERTDYQAAVNQPVSSTVNLLRVQVDILGTNAEIVRSLSERTISGEFVGSTESLLNTEYVENDDNTASLTITETRPNPFPMLEAVGRGRFTLELPAGVPLDIRFGGQDGQVNLNLGGLALERLNVDVIKGDTSIALPEYQPLASAPDELLGTLVARQGNITLVIPSAVATHFELNRGSSGLEPAYDALIYNYLVGDILEARNFDSAEIKLRYAITAPRGQISIQASAG